MAHVYNPHCSGGSDQEDYHLKPAWGKQRDPILIKTIRKRERTEENRMNQSGEILVIYVTESIAQSVLSR
jgi:hypothetical protein